MIGDGHVLLTGLPETRALSRLIPGIPDWRPGAAELVYSTAMWTALFVPRGRGGAPGGSRGGPAP